MAFLSIRLLADFVTITLELNAQENLRLSLFDSQVKSYELDYYSLNDQNKLDFPLAFLGANQPFLILVFGKRVRG